MPDRASRSRLKSRVASAALGIALLGGAAPCAAASRLEASLGFGGYCPPERWVPLRITAGELPRSALIQVLRLAEDGRELGSESFPAAEGFAIEAPAWTGGELDSIVVRLASEGRVLAEARVDARAKAFPGHVVLACGLSTRARLAITASLMPLEPVLALDIPSSELPANGLDYDAVSAVAIGDRGIELSPAQRTALLAWLSGGGRLCATSSARGSPGLLESLGLEEGVGPGAAGGSAFGLGSYATLGAEATERPGAWRDALALAPYDSAARLGAGTFARLGRTATAIGGIAPWTQAAVALAIAVWLVATLAAVGISRPPRGRGLGKPGLLAAVAAVCLAAVLLGGTALDRAFQRGALLSARAIALPGSGAAFVSFRAGAYVPPATLDWAASAAIGKPSLAYDEAESGSFGEWRHSLGRSVFALRSAGTGALELEGMLAPEAWRAIASSSTPALATRGDALGGESLAGGREPPEEIESAYPLAYLASGDAPSWWERKPGASWARSESAPAWLGDDADLMLGLRGGKRALAVLAGACAGAALPLGAEGAPLGELRWAMPLPAPKGARR